MLEFKGRNRKLGSGIPRRNRKLELEKGAQIKNLKQVCRDLESSARNSKAETIKGRNANDGTHKSTSEKRIQRNSERNAPQKPLKKRTKSQDRRASLS